MIKLYNKNYDYELKTTKECLIGKLRNSTFQGLFNYYKHYKDYTFYGKIFEENFEIKSVPASSRRSLFNPLIIGKFSSKSNTNNKSNTVNQNSHKVRCCRACGRPDYICPSPVYY